MELQSSLLGKYTLGANGTLLIGRKRTPSVDHHYVMRLEWVGVPKAEYYVLRRMSINKQLARTRTHYQRST